MKTCQIHHHLSENHKPSLFSCDSSKERKKPKFGMMTLNLSSSYAVSPKLVEIRKNNPSEVLLLSNPCISQFKKNKHLSFNVKAQQYSSTPQESQQFHKQQKFSSSYDSPSTTPLPVQSTAPKVYVAYSIYKGKAALQVEPRSPEFVPLDSGAFKLSREGFVLLQFAPAAGVRQYDWGRKQVFSLSVTEIGNIISLGAKDSCEFFHDPFKGKSDEGKVRKVLKVEPLPDGSGHFFNLSVQNKLMNLDESIYIPISRAEFAVLVSSFNFIIPHLLGWHTFVNAVKLEDTNRANNTNPRSVDYEWNR